MRHPEKSEYSFYCTACVYLLDWNSWDGKIITRDYKLWLGSNIDCFVFLMEANQHKQRISSITIKNWWFITKNTKYLDTLAVNQSTENRWQPLRQFQSCLISKCKCKHFFFYVNTDSSFRNVSLSKWVTASPKFGSHMQEYLQNRYSRLLRKG